MKPGHGTTHVLIVRRLIPVVPKDLPEGVSEETKSCSTPLRCAQFRNESSQKIQIFESFYIAQRSLKTHVNAG